MFGQLEEMDCLSILFILQFGSGSDSDDGDEEAKRVREERLAAYAAKKANKTAVIAKTSVLLDVKPWDDETDMDAMCKGVKAIQMDGLVWGACESSKTGSSSKSSRHDLILISPPYYLQPSWSQSATASTS